MEVAKNILDLLREKEAEALRRTYRGMIIQPGAIGDCILTLPLADFIKKSLGLGGIDLVGNTEYIGFFPGRTCIDSVRSLHCIDLHRLFMDVSEFDLEDDDALIKFFADYNLIVTFLGESDSNFEKNLIFTANCSYSAEVITLPMKPTQGVSRHLTEFYIEQFTSQYQVASKRRSLEHVNALINHTRDDEQAGRELLAARGICPQENLIIVHPGSGGQHKCWCLDNFLALTEALTAKNYQPIFLLGPAELERFSHTKIDAIRRIAKCLTCLSLTEVLSVLACVEAFIGNDSGISHLAAAMGIKTLSVFGPTNPTIYRPFGPSVKVFISDTEAFTNQSSTCLQEKLLNDLINWT